MSDVTCKRQLEATNAGHYFSDCACGWSGGVYPRRADAHSAWRAHVLGEETPAPVKPTILFGPRAGGEEFR